MLDGPASLLPPRLEGRLFPRVWLDAALPETPEWAAVTDRELDAVAARIAPLAEAIAGRAPPTEAETEAELIFPVLEAIGWHDLRQQRAGAGRRDIPDALLFPDREARTDAARAHAGTPARYLRASLVLENKAWGRPLDRADADRRTAANQILHYLRRAEELSEGTIRWGVLTNGRLWRLYTQRVESRAERFLEADLPAILAHPDAAARRAALRGFLLFFRPAAHHRDDGGRSFLDRALEAGRRHESGITSALTRAVFQKTFPELVTAIAAGDPAAEPNDAEWRRQVNEAALVLLYRCLFVLYAEDRGLLPVGHPGYGPYAFRALREDAAKVRERTLAVAARGGIWWSRIRTLFDAIAAGNRDFGLPEYNGGLFDDTDRPLLRRIALGDAALAELIEDLSRGGGGLDRRWINYRDLSVQQLGAIYEGLLEREVAPDPAAPGGVAVRPNAFARRTTGSYYTPDDLVMLVIRRAVGPLLAERIAKFRASAAVLASDRRPVAQRLAELARDDPAEAYLRLKVCDPAMGSGHFLVSLVDWLADETLAATAAVADAVSWGDYVSPLAATLEAMRGRILARAKAGGWHVPPARLDDKALVRRILLKRVVHGVDLNPMAVELAKLSLWLHSFTVGAPLSFLDHHLRCGDSLFGEFVGPLVESGEAPLSVRSSVAPAAELAAKGMASIEAIADADLDEVHESEKRFDAMEEVTGPIRRFLDVVHAKRWLDPAPKSPERDAYAAMLDGSLGDPVRVVGGEDAPGGRRKDLRDAAAGLLARARALAAERRFLHWEAAFPNVWANWTSVVPQGGFDAVIGNPPWDRVKLQEVEWFAARVPEIAREARAADRKRRIAALRKRGGEIAEAYERTAWTAEAAARVARGGKDWCAYPLLGGGDVNLYSLFVERALRLVRADGMVGLLVPSGIAADKGAAAFFGGVADAGRLAAFLDFENRRTTLGLDPFFPDVDSRFKFAVLAVGGVRRRFAKAHFAFFQQDAATAEAAAYRLSPRALRRLNPNTGTAPVFRTRRDAALTLAIHRRLPVLVRHERHRRVAVWPVRYATMFHMTNDSGRFRTEAELAKAGAYRVAANRWKRGAEEWVPLYEGKMVQAFDHRAASVVVNADNLHRPAQPEPTGPIQHADASWLPTPQFWVARTDIEWPAGLDWAIGFKDVTSPTNVRTMIAAIVPAAAFGNTLPLLLPEPPPGPELPSPEHHRRREQRVRRSRHAYAAWAPLLLANLNALVFDFIARQKVQGQHLNFFIVEQLPVVPRIAYRRRFGPVRADRLIRDHVLRLTYTAHDLAGFARDQGHDGPPFRWDEEERLHLRARLDALFFLLYGLGRDAAGHVLATFPIVKREEEARFAGRFRSRDLVLGYMAALAAGDPDSRVAS